MKLSKKIESKVLGKLLVDVLVDVVEKAGKEVVSCQDDVGKALLEELVKALLLQAFLPEGLSPATFAKLKLVKVEAVLNLCLEGCLLQAVLLEVLSQGFAKLKAHQGPSCNQNSYLQSWLMESSKNSP